MCTCTHVSKFCGDQTLTLIKVSLGLTGLLRRVQINTHGLLRFPQCNWTVQKVSEAPTEKHVCVCVCVCEIDRNKGVTSLINLT